MQRNHPLFYVLLSISKLFVWVSVEHSTVNLEFVSSGMVNLIANIFYPLSTIRASNCLTMTYLYCDGCFRNSLDDWYSCHPESDSVVSSCSHIPPIPVTTDNINQTTVINSKRAGYTASAIASIALEKRKSGHEHDHALLSGGLEGLRHLAEIRERNKDQNEAEKRKEKSDGELRTRLVSICVLCDALRSKCMMNNRVSIKTTDIINQLSKELSILPKELMIRLQLLTSIVPEYLTIVQPDNVVSFSVVRFNMQVSYDQVRKKLASYATTTLSKLT